MSADNWMQTASGLAFDPLDPRPEDVCIEDIAASLSRLCRFVGHCIPPLYSVAQHSVLVSRQVPQEHRLAGLLHDAAEAYCSDVHPAVKKAAPGYREIEHGVALAIGDRFGVELVDLPQSVHNADLVLLATERRDLMRWPGPRSWRSIEGVAPLADPIIALPQNMAESLFLAEFHAIVNGVDAPLSERLGVYEVGGVAV